MNLKIKAVLILTAVLAFGSITAPTEAATPTFNLTIKVFGLDKKYAPKIKVTGPSGYSKVVTAPAKFQKNIVLKNLKKGTYTVSPLAVTVNKKIKRAVKSSYKIALTKSTGVTVNYSKAFLALRTSNVREYKMGRQALSKAKSTSKFEIAPLSAGGQRISPLAEVPTNALPNLDAYLKSGSVSSGFATFLGNSALGIDNPRTLETVSLINSAAYVGENHLSIEFDSRFPVKLFEDSRLCRIAVFDLVNGLSICILFVGESYSTTGEKLISTKSGMVFLPVCMTTTNNCPKNFRNEPAHIMRYSITTGERVFLGDIGNGDFSSKALVPPNGLYCIQQQISSLEKSLSEILSTCESEYLEELANGGSEQLTYPAEAITAEPIWRPAADGGLYYLKQGIGGGIFRILSNGQEIKIVDSPEAVQNGYGAVFFEEYSDGKLYFGFDTLFLNGLRHSSQTEEYGMSIFPRPEIALGERAKAFGIYTDSFDFYPTALPEIKIYDPILNQVEDTPWLAFSEDAENNWEDLCQPFKDFYPASPDIYLSCPTPFEYRPGWSTLTPIPDNPFPHPINGIYNFENSNQSIITRGTTSNPSRNEVTSYSTTAIFRYWKRSSSSPLSCGVMQMFPVVEKYEIGMCPSSSFTKVNEALHFSNVTSATEVDFYVYNLTSNTLNLLGTFEGQLEGENSASGAYFDVFQNSFVWSTTRLATDNQRYLNVWKFNPTTREISSSENPNADYTANFLSVQSDFIYPAIG